jgi:hypothetical protein
MKDYQSDMGGMGEGMMSKKPAAKPRKDTFFLPSGFPGMDSFKPGQTITLKVVGRDAEGDIEVAVGDGEEPSFADDLRTSMAESDEDEAAVSPDMGEAELES